MRKIPISGAVSRDGTIKSREKIGTGEIFREQLANFFFNFNAIFIFAIPAITTAIQKNQFETSN